MQPTFYVREIPVYGDLILSPMDGFSDLPYRLICREFGSAMSYTEFTACEAILRDAKPALRQLDYHPCEKPQLTFQIFDSDEDRIVACAQKIELLGPGIIDLNMGCSVSSVSGRGAGAGLLRDPQKIGRIFNRMSKAVRVPVTGKIRLGWDAKSRNYIEVAKILEDNGASLVAVHGRTKEQAYKGVADWDAIAEVKQAVKIPVIGNGDVKTVADIARIKAHTGCDGVMIGRAAIGNPWIFQRKDRHEVTVEEVIALLKRHLRAMIEYYGDHGLILFRKHAVKYMHGMPHVAALRAQLVTCESVGAFHDLVDDFQRRYQQGLLPDSAYEPMPAPEEETEWSCDRAAVACA
ncbi:MAG: tRNA dihydrouridine synthase DusB [Anaerolineae bacterium]|nr:tRNA dihydrouridine synthase DusB [Candidatus Roseilinea sp.]MDW8450642.1 tRNA dihydrouridine synthase DusB [Anaerolineae bacterium]